MKTRCPSCGATASLDVLIGHEAASQALSEVFSINGMFGKAIVQYLGLFRSGTRELTFTRLAKLMGEIRPDIIRRQITRDRIDYPAPPEAWIYAIEQTLHARDTGKLTLPLKGHGFLYAIITQFKPEQYSAAHNTSSQHPELAPKPKIQLTPAQEKLEQQINATTSRLKSKEQ